MSWETSKTGGRLRWIELDGADRIGRLVLRPVTDLDRDGRTTSAIPNTHPAYVLCTLKVESGHQGQGHGRSLLDRGARHLVSIHGDVWFGLMTDNYNHPPGLTRADVRSVWDSFVEDHPSATIQDGFIFLTLDLDLGVDP